MKKILFIPFVLLFLSLTSCETVRVYSDYDKNVNFDKFKTYAFFKAGIDKVEISDLDKKRILRAIDEEMTAKGFTKSENPDILININTKAEKNVNVNQFNNGWGFGWGWGGGFNPFFGYQQTYSSSTTGILTIDFIDASKKELFWQGEGEGYLTKNVDYKDENIKTFVFKILEQFPPKLSK